MHDYRAASKWLKRISVFLFLRVCGFAGGPGQCAVPASLEVNALTGQHVTCQEERFKERPRAAVKHQFSMVMVRPSKTATKGGLKGKARKPNNLVEKLPTEVAARRLENLFDKLPTEVVYTVGHFSSSCYRK